MVVQIGKNPISEGETFFKTHKQEENITTKKATRKKNAIPR